MLNAAFASTTPTADEKPDPIFEAMERYPRAEAKIEAIPDDEENTRLGAALAESARARLGLAETAPTTLRGLAAFARFLSHQSKVVLDDAFFDNDDEHMAFYASLDRSLAAIIRGSTSPPAAA